MTLVLKGLIEFNGAQAKAEVKAVAGELKNMGSAATSAGQGAGGAAGGVEALGRESTEAAAAARALALAEQQAARDAVLLGQNSTMAAGSVGNIAAQFNDIGMMMAAGQNPFQLAIQQGTQLGQVLGPMGVRGALRSIAQGFMAMLSPVNLVTIGTIAAGAALFQWLTSAEESASSAETLADDIDSLSDAMQRLREADKSASSDVMDIVARYGQYADQAREILAIEREVAAVRADRAFAVASRGVAEGIGAGNIGGMTPADFAIIDEAYTKMLSYETDLEAAMADTSDVFVRRADDIAAYSAAVADVTSSFGVTTQAAQELLAMNVALNAADTTEARAEAARQLAQYIFDSTNGLQTASDEAIVLYDQLLSAVTAGLDLQALDIASTIGAGADEAERLAANARDAANAWLEARSLAQQPGNLANSRYADRGTSSNRPIEDGSGNIIRNTPVRGVGGGRRGGGGGGARAEAESVADLIEKLQAEVDVSRELDPIQREMLQYRQQLANATASERQQVQELIVQREREKAVTESLQYVGQQTGNALIDALMGGADAGERLIDVLMRAALQALILGQGPLAGLFGGGGGLLGGLFGGGGGGGIGGLGLPLPFADGGLVYGEGGPRDDKVPARLSPGEFVVNARATRRNRRLLEAINEGGRAYADGGMVGGGSAGPGGMSGGMVINANFDLRGAQGDDAVRKAAKEGMQEALREFASAELPSHVRRTMNSPEVVRF